MSVLRNGNRREAIVKITEFCGAVFITPVRMVSQEKPQYTELRFTKQGADEFTLGSLRDLMIQEGWFRDVKDPKGI